MTQDIGHLLDRRCCVVCGKCVRGCHARALEVIGKSMTAAEVMSEVVKDLSYYKASRGGLTLSGGEPLSQPDFAAAILALSRDAGIHTTIETSGAVSWAAFEKVLPHTDLFLYDFKESDPDRLLQTTGADYGLIHENLRRLDETGIELVLRCPIIPGVNDRDEHFHAIGAMADTLKNVSRVEIEPYHPLGQSKSQRIGKTHLFTESIIPDKETVKLWASSVGEYTHRPVKHY